MGGFHFLEWVKMVGPELPEKLAIEFLNGRLF